MLHLRKFSIGRGVVFARYARLNDPVNPLNPPIGHRRDGIAGFETFEALASVPDGVHNGLKRYPENLGRWITYTAAIMGVGPR